MKKAEFSNRRILLKTDKYSSLTDPHSVSELYSGDVFEIFLQFYKLPSTTSRSFFFFFFFFFIFFHSFYVWKFYVWISVRGNLKSSKNLDKVRNLVKTVGVPSLTSSPLESLRKGNWVKLICGASFEVSSTKPSNPIYHNHFYMLEY